MVTFIGSVRVLIVYLFLGSIISCILAIIRYIQLLIG